jgi:hypothetical protein
VTVCEARLVKKYEEAHGFVMALEHAVKELENQVTTRGHKGQN